MPVVDSIILGDNPITFTISFVINVVLVWYMWTIVRPMKDENIKLKSKLDDKDKVITELTKENKESLAEVMSKLVAISTLIAESAEDYGKYVNLLEKMYDRTKQMQEDGKVCREELRDIERTLTTMANSLDNINHKQMITQSLLFPLNGMGHEGVTKVK